MSVSVQSGSTSLPLATWTNTTATIRSVSKARTLPLGRPKGGRALVGGGLSGSLLTVFALNRRSP